MDIAVACADRARHGLRDGKDFIVASATCSLDDLRAIRAAIDAKIQEAEAWAAK